MAHSGMAGIFYAENAPAPIAKGGVLLVEDDKDIRAVLAECLEYDGMSVTEADSAEAALALLHDGFSPAVVVTDINLGPGENGVSLADCIHILHPDVTIVFITGRMDMLRDRGLRTWEQVLPKPFPLTALTNIVRNCGASASAHF